MRILLPLSYSAITDSFLPQCTRTPFSACMSSVVPSCHLSSFTLAHWLLTSLNSRSGTLARDVQIFAGSDLPARALITRAHRLATVQQWNVPQVRAPIRPRMSLTSTPCHSYTTTSSPRTSISRSRGISKTTLTAHGAGRPRNTHRGTRVRRQTTTAQLRREKVGASFNSVFTYRRTGNV